MVSIPTREELTTQLVKDFPDINLDVINNAIDRFFYFLKTDIDNSVKALYTVLKGVKYS